METGACRPWSRGSQRARQDWMINTYCFFNSLTAIIKVIQLEQHDKEDWDKVILLFIFGHLSNPDTIWNWLLKSCGLPRWFSGKESACQCRRPRRCGFDSWVRKFPWRRKWQLTPVFLPEKSHGQRNLAVYSSWGCKESDTTEWLSIAQDIGICAWGRKKEKED